MWWPLGASVLGVEPKIAENLDMQPLNYCRQMAKQFADLIAVPSLDATLRESMDHCITLARVSTKFMLPPGGHLIDDSDFRALDDDADLNLPFSCIALEWSVPRIEEDGPLELYKPMRVNSSKRIVFAQQTEWGIGFRCVSYLDSSGIFHVFDKYGLMHGNYLNRANYTDGVPGIKVRIPKASGDPRGEENCVDEARVLLGFLNALQCSNVRLDKKITSARTPKAAHLFDSYRVLTIESKRAEGSETGLGGNHRSPREHLRRGHIRRLESGAKKIWVNATVVNAGVGGKVTKDYAVHA